MKSVFLFSILLLPLTFKVQANQFSKKALKGLHAPQGFKQVEESTANEEYLRRLMNYTAHEPEPKVKTDEPKQLGIFDSKPAEFKSGFSVEKFKKSFLNAYQNGPISEEEKEGLIGKLIFILGRSKSNTEAIFKSTEEKGTYTRTAQLLFQDPTHPILKVTTKDLTKILPLSPLYAIDAVAGKRVNVKYTKTENQLHVFTEEIHPGLGDANKSLPNRHLSTVLDAKSYEFISTKQGNIMDLAATDSANARDKNIYKGNLDFNFEGTSISNHYQTRSFSVSTPKDNPILSVYAIPKKELRYDSNEDKMVTRKEIQLVIQTKKGTEIRTVSPDGPEASIEIDPLLNGTQYRLSSPPQTAPPATR